VRPLDPRLLRQAGPARGYLAGAVCCGIVTTGLVLAQAGLLAHVIAHASSGLDALRASIIGLALVLAARAVTTYGGDVLALRAAAATKSELRHKLLDRIVALGPQWLGRRSHGELITLAGRGLDALDPYFAKYLPQLVLSAIIPVAVLVRIAGSDLESAVTIAVTLPLIPVFMALIGWHTQQRTDRQWTQLTRLAGHFLDVVEGLPTLKAFGRAKAQAETIRRVTEDHRQATMATLRIAFVSALVLELIATLSTAVVAVEVGLRLLAGHLGYESALLVLLLTPEAYLPLRAIGTQFHAAAEGVAAAKDVLDVLDTPLPFVSVGVTAVDRAVDLSRDVISFEQVSVRYPGRPVPALDGLTTSVRPGERLAVVGPSGAGKSTLLSLLLGFTAASEGALTIGGRDLRQFSAAGLADLRRQIAWVPQHAHLFSGSIEDNIRLSDPAAGDADVRRAADLAGLTETIAAAPAGLETPVGERGLLLSTGQRQRVAIARALLRDPALLLLDEPGAHLDAATAREVIANLRRYASGRTLIIVTHNPAWTVGADRVVHLTAGRLVPEPAGQPGTPVGDRQLARSGSGGSP
jgi:ATP-binding cassette subfamily C protein CydD